NRHMFRDRLEHEIGISNRRNVPFALMFIDLDHFKEVNDTLGHGMGDLLLIEATRRLNECVRRTDIVARMGGDEFTVLLTEIENLNHIDRIAENIIAKLATAFLLKKEIAYVSASIGITLYPNDATTIEGLLKNADQAMYVAKEQGRNRLSYFTPALHEAAQNRLRLVNDLRGALEAKQFMVYFQPIIELASGEIHKAEALIRWQHPERGFVSPAQFIPLAEETGLILAIGDWVFRQSMNYAKRWRELYRPTFQVSVNKSPIQFYQDGEDHTAWLAFLKELGLPGQSLNIEITEGLLLDSNSAINGALLTLRNNDIQVSIDDFGTGYSSLSYLKKFDIDYLKIDQSFIRNLKSDHNDRVLCEAIIVMAHKLGIKVVAEGVETTEQRDLLATAGCDYVQGYLYSRPVPPEAFEALLKQGHLQI
ncbi:MAG: bifunctional diguanylate cyclase/phosphodiesterase, partial [Gammaproteobacteria bacterium]|nr:bifunctional diguanylate cyclase/phosphodiesterase [Gammaproteobacteria bacterium]